MKLIVEVPEEQYRTLNARTQKEVTTIIDYGLLGEAIKNGIALPNTNGEVFKTMFPNAEVEFIDTDEYTNKPRTVIVILGEYAYFIGADCWNAPYRKENADADSD